MKDLSACIHNVHMITGPVFDYNYDGVRDNTDDIHRYNSLKLYQRNNSVHKPNCKMQFDMLNLSVKWILTLNAIANL